GGALLKLSVFALGIMPYITASIIIQLLTVVIPRFEQLKKEGQSGQNKLTQYTRYLTIALAILQSTGIIALAVRGQLFGNCMSILMFANIASRIPSEGSNIMTNGHALVFTVICVFGLAIIASVVFMEQGQRRIPVQYAKRMIGRRMYGGTSTYLPLKVNQAGVIPVIFASSLLYLPSLIAKLVGNQQSNSAWQRFISSYLTNQSNWV